MTAKASIAEAAKPSTQNAALLVCALCGLCARNHIHFGSHVANTHRLPVKRYYSRYDSNPCETCGQQIPFKSDRGQTLRRKFCSLRCNSKAQKGAGHHNWHGGSHTSEGYIRCSLFKFDEKHHHILQQMMQGRTGVLEHRALMAIRLQRPLTARETVHHINGNKTDNRIENLELHVGPHGKGVRVRDLLCPHCGKAYGE